MKMDYHTRMIRLKRVYETPEKSDGKRILVDRLWPRGISKEKGEIDGWLKDVAPSNELRTWFNHDPKKWEDFKKKYKEELKEKKELIDQLREQAKQQTITLLYGAKDTEHNQAIVLLEVLSK